MKKWIQENAIIFMFFGGVMMFLAVLGAILSMPAEFRHGIYPEIRNNHHEVKQMIEDIDHKIEINRVMFSSLDQMMKEDHR